MKEPEQEHEKKTIASWNASLALTASSWARGEVPSHFARHAVEAATEELGKEALGHAAAPTIALAHDFQEAVERDDRAAAARIARELDAQSKALQ